MNAHPLVRAGGASAALATLLAPAAAQTFSIDWQSPTINAPVIAAPITEGDILTPTGGPPRLGPLPVPSVLISAGPAGLGLPAFANCFAGVVPPCQVEVDALSFGQDFPLGTPVAANAQGRVWLSVDEYARGIGFLSFPPGVQSESVVGDSSADLFLTLQALPPGPLPPPAVGSGHVGVLDGDGLTSGSGYAYPGLGLVEPNPPFSSVIPNPGDNVDAFDREGPPAFGFPLVFFSLDASYVDPIDGTPHSGSAAANGFNPGDVIVAGPFAISPTVFASAFQLGLNQTAASADDLDALILRENGNNVYDPSIVPNDWLTGATDMLLFSVRRGSSIIGMPDSIFGLPIEEGDILTRPVGPSTGGVSPFPGIYVAAEWLGLQTRRSAPNIIFGDDLNALDASSFNVFDCNSNGVEDAVDIVQQTSTDVNQNGIPDECESAISSFCFCAVNAAPCGNPDPNAGCRNSTGSGALLSASGTTSVFSDDLRLLTTNVVPNQFGINFMGPLAGLPMPLGDGLRCVFGGLHRFPVQNSGNAGSMTEGPGIVAFSQGNFPNAGQIMVGQTWLFQSWYRDPAGPCGQGSNLSNAVSVTFTQ